MLLAEIDAACQLPDNQYVRVSARLLADRGDIFEPAEDLRGTKVREQPQFLPDAEQALLGSNRGIVPLLAPDRAEKNGICIPTRV